MYSQIEFTNVNRAFDFLNTELGQGTASLFPPACSVGLMLSHDQATDTAKDNDIIVLKDFNY